MEKQKKPTTKSEIEQDIINHPDRGKIGGIDVFADEKREIRGRVSSELKQKFLRITACFGLDTSAGLEQALCLWWSHHKDSVESSELEKSIKFQVPISEIQKKALGNAKARGRKKRLNLLSRKEGNDE